MDDAGTPTAAGDLLQQMKNCYADLDKVLKHYGCTFDDVVVENVFTTYMAAFLEHSSYRNSIYTKRFPTGSWLEVKGLALPEFLIEIELEVHRPTRLKRSRRAFRTLAWSACWPRNPCTSNPGSSSSLSISVANSSSMGFESAPMTCVTGASTAPPSRARRASERMMPR